jgi:4-diphosphocytidyl-2-C-methyl-D-erythritol kinase
MRAPAIRVLAPAKINLHLRVGPPTADGFHPLLSWMVTVSLFDKLDLELSPAQSLTCDDPSIPTDSSNLITKAIEAIRQAAPQVRGEPWSIRAVLQKRIPAGAGLGGGSSDAAATLSALNRLLNLNWPIDRLAKIAARLGSDVPFFLHGPSSICTGRGEIVTPTLPPKVRHAVLLLPPIHLPTPDAYRRFDQMHLGHPNAVRETVDWHQWSTLAAADFLPLLTNDLEPPAFSINPGLAELHKRATDALGRIVRMSGSGSSLFSLFDSRPQAESAAVTLQNALSIRAIAVDLCPNLPPKDISE